MTTQSAAGPDVWDRAIAIWDVAFFAVIAIGIGLSLTDDDLPAGNAHRAVALLVVLAGWYAVVGTRALRSRAARPGLLYLAGMIPLFLAAFAQYDTLGLLLFVLYAQAWTVTESQWPAVAGDGLIALGVGAIGFVRYDRSLPAVAVQAVASFAFALAMGFWISGIIRQSVGRRAVIAELEEARAELAAVSHRAGVLAERERMAREIHDTLAQGFTSVVMLLDLAESEVDTDPAAARRRLAAAQETARQNLAESRALVAALTPVDLQAAPLPEAVGRLVDRFGRETGQPAAFTVTGSPRTLQANQEIVLLRAAQEALTNVRKHAGPCRVTLGLDYADPVRLVVADDGAGFDPAAIPAGYGLSGMRARVASVGGSLSVHSGSTGTTVEVRCSG